MLDIFKVKSDGKWYSTKVRIQEVNETTMRVAIKSVHEVRLISATSHQVVRQIFEADEGTTFSQSKFNDIFKKTMESIAKKYKVTNIIYSER